MSYARWRLHLADVVDDLGDLVPGSHDREHQRLDRLLGHGEGVALVEDATTVDEIADVRDARDVRVDHGVQFTVHLDVEARGGERVAATDGVHTAREGRGDLLRDRLQRPDLGRRVGLQDWPAAGSSLKWSRCSCVTRIASAPTAASSSVKVPGSMTSTRPSFSDELQAWLTSS